MRAVWRTLRTGGVGAQQHRREFSKATAQRRSSQVGISAGKRRGRMYQIQRPSFGYLCTLFNIHTLEIYITH